MKTTMTMFRTSLVALFLTLSANAFAQVVAPIPTTPIANPGNLEVGTLNDNTAPVTIMADAVLFYNYITGVGPNLTLAASLLDENGLAFTDYVWIRVTNDGGNEEFETLSETENELSLENLAPGYHKYRIHGIVDNEDEVICQSDEFQDIILFVLRPLDLTATATDAIARFCANDIPDGNLDLNVAVDFNSLILYNDNGYDNPAVGGFNLTYRWYAVETGNDETEAANQISLATNENISGATNDISIPYGDLSFATTAGTYRFYVEVRYSDDIKNPGDRAHALWTGVVGGDTPVELEITPIPGRPTITIEEIID